MRKNAVKSDATPAEVITQKQEYLDSAIDAAEAMVMAWYDLNTAPTPLPIAPREFLAEEAAYQLLKRTRTSVTQIQYDDHLERKKVLLNVKQRRVLFGLTGQDNKASIIIPSDTTTLTRTRLIGMW